MFKGFDGEPEPENKAAKENISDKLAPHLKPDGEVIWKGVKSVTSAGACNAANARQCQMFKCHKKDWPVQHDYILQQ